MRETDIFSPQARDSRIMCESWQVYYYAYMFDSIQIKLVFVRKSMNFS